MLAFYHLRRRHTTDPTHAQCDAFPPSKHDAFTQLLVQCWAGVLDDGPALNQHWVSDTCLLGSKHNTFVQRLYNDDLLSPTLDQHCINVTQMLCVYWDLPCSYHYQRLSTHEALTQCWIKFGPATQIVGQTASSRSLQLAEDCRASFE